ncbi:MAG: TspO/MBR family protein [Patescibacteria group bacterium]|nr:TspO/MBR family protein [Patescibacteria group bacterium]
MRPKNILVLVAFILLCEAAGAIGSIFTASAIPTWYATLVRPSFAPPNWLFGPVWTTLYALMGISLYLVWSSGWKRREVKIAVSVFLVHLALNAAWSWMFFGLRSPITGLIGIIGIWVFIVALFFLFRRIKPLAAYLLIPYFLWVSFASAVNFELWRLN